MIKLLEYWQSIVLTAILLIGAAELCLRALWIGRYHPEIKHSPWSQVPRILWLAMTENRLHLFELLRGRRSSCGPTILVLLLALVFSLVVADTTIADEPLKPVAAPERLGPVWPIVEQDMRETIRTRLEARLPEMKTRLRQSLATYRVPATLRPTTDTPRTLFIDPSVTLAADLKSHDGRLLAAAGQTVNPLTILPLRRTYLVMNGADPRQVAWAKREIEARPRSPFMVLLTDGLLDEMRRTLPAIAKVLPAPALLFTRLPIESVPARLHRDGTRLQIDLIAEAALPPSPSPDESGQTAGVVRNNAH